MPIDPFSIVKIIEGAKTNVDQLTDTIKTVTDAFNKMVEILQDLDNEVKAMREDLEEIKKICYVNIGVYRDQENLGNIFEHRRY